MYCAPPNLETWLRAWRGLLATVRGPLASKLKKS